MGYAGGMKHEDTIAKVREIVDRHRLPGFIIDYDVNLGDFDGDPALWVVFRVTPGPSQRNAEVDRRVAEMKTLHDALRPELLAAFEDRFPYFRYQTAALKPVAAPGE